MANNTLWTDFNDVEEQTTFSLIPSNTLAKVRLTIIPGDYDDEASGFSGNWATKSKITESVYLSCLYTVIAGEYKNRKIFGLIGLHSPKGDTWAKLGRKFIRTILASSRGIYKTDTSEKANESRKIKNFGELDGIEFIANIEIQKGSDEKEQNIIRTAITPDHPEYKRLMNEIPNSTSSSKSYSYAAAKATTTIPWAR